MELKKKLLSGTFIPVVIGMSVAVGSEIQPASGATRAENPTAIPRGADAGRIILAACNPCNPCAAANPCGACNPCNPCAAGGDDVELSGAQAKAAYACIRASLKAGYAKSGNQWVKSYQSWTNYATQPYISDTHGGRFVNNYANARGSNYGLYENAGPAPEGTVLAKDSFSVKPNGKVGAGPMFLMEKMAAGFSSDSQDWRYTLIMPNGQVFGTTGGKNSDKVGFCAECHAVVEDQDSRFYLDEEYRRK